MGWRTVKVIERPESLFKSRYRSRVDNVKTKQRDLFIHTLGEKIHAVEPVEEGEEFLLSAK